MQRFASSEFAVPEGGPYLLTHSVGCLLRGSAAALESEYLEPWRTLGGDAWPAWLAAIDRFCDALVLLFGDAAGNYCPQTNLSSGLTKIIAALPPPRAERRVLLASQHSFPSMAFVLQRAAGYSVRLIAQDQPPGALETWQHALAAGDVHAALITHVHSNTGAVAPVEQIAAECRARDIFSIVDVAQSAGILALQMADLGADAVLGSCVKWLCGGPGAGFLWLRPAFVERLSPTDVGWFSHEDPFEFDPLHFRYAHNARRFWGGTPSIAPFVIAAAAMRRLAQIGIPAIRAHNLHLQELLADGLGQTWFPAGPQNHSGGTCCLSLGGQRESMAAALRRHGVRFDVRADTLRLSFHLYNDTADVRMVAAALNAVVRRP